MFSGSIEGILGVEKRGYWPKMGNKYIYIKRNKCNKCHEKLNL